MKKTVFALISALLVLGCAEASQKSPEEIRLVQAAEEISASAMDDDEKIGRLTEIEASVREIRSRRPVSEISFQTPATGAAPANPRPLSTFVRKQTEETLSPTPGIPADERGPTPLVRMGYWIMRFVGWVFVVGISAAALLFVGIAVMAFFERLEASRETPSPKVRKRSDFIARDGVVPERLR